MYSQQYFIFRHAHINSNIAVSIFYLLMEKYIKYLLLVCIPAGGRSSFHWHPHQVRDVCIMPELLTELVVEHTEFVPRNPRFHGVGRQSVFSRYNVQFDSAYAVTLTTPLH
jgi:hypothetical protein